MRFFGPLLRWLLFVKPGMCDDKLHRERVDFLAQVIRDFETETMRLKVVFDDLIKVPREGSPVAAFDARERLVASFSQLTGVRMAWEIMTDELWITENPDMQVAESRGLAPKSAIAE